MGLLRARVAELEKVKITSGLATKIQKVVAERDALLAEKRRASGGLALLDKENSQPADEGAGECRQS